MRFFVLFFFYAFFVNAQQRVTLNESFAQPKIFEKFTLFDDTKIVLTNNFAIANLNWSKLKNLHSQAPNHVELDLPFLDQKLRLSKTQLFSPDFTLELSDHKKVVPLDVRTYSGFLIGSDSYATMTIAPDFISMIVATEQLGNIEISTNKSGQCIIRKSTHLEGQYQCSTPNDKVDESRSTNTRSNADCLELYIEVDNAAFIANGSSVAATQTWVTNIFNNVKTLYNTYNVPIVVSGIFIWDTTDPFASQSTITGVKNAFVTRLTQLAITNKIGYLLSTRSLGGGLSHGIGGFCNPITAYPGPCAISTQLSTTFASVPTYSYTIQNVAHELGHVMGLRHTHACVWNGNNTQIDDCGNIIAVNNNGTPEGICYNTSNPILPGANGTIMSNCNNLPGQAINLATGFGSIVGNTLFLNFVNASCQTANACGTTPPLNDECINAIPLTLTTTCPASPKIYDSKYGTQSATTPLFSCLTQSYYTDIWFTAIVPSSGNLSLETRPAAGSAVDDWVMQLYAGPSCASLSQIACDDDSGIDLHALIVLTGRTPGEKIYIRITPKDKPGSDDYGDFGLCGYDASVPCHPDKASLVSLYNATGGASWIIKSGWSANATNCDVCSWYGVVCNTNGRVKELNLGNNNLTGSIPNSIINLSQLEKLNVYGNHFTAAPLPLFLDDLPLLSYIDLGNNSFNGTIPIDFGSMPNLRTLLLDNNALTGSLPANLSNAPISNLWLNNNNLSGCIPNSFVLFCSSSADVRLNANTQLPNGGNFNDYCLNGTGGNADNDGYCKCAAVTCDCDDLNPLTFPGATEICDGKDNDCDLLIDESVADLTNTWLGTTNGNWNDATRWSTGYVPQKCHNVVLPTGSYIVTIPNGYLAKASSVTLNTNSQLRIQFNSTLSVNDKGVIVNNGLIQNYGILNLQNPLNVTGISINNNGVFQNFSSGSVNILNAGSTAIANQSTKVFENSGTVTITNNHITNGLFGINNMGVLNNSGQIIIANINGKELRVAIGALLENSDLGTIELK